MLGGNFGNDRIFQDNRHALVRVRWSTKRSISLNYDSLGVAVSHQLGLLEVWVALYLVESRDNISCLKQSFDFSDGKV